MAIGGHCMSCKRFSPGLFTCKSCGSRCCPLCVDSKNGFCKLCGGIKRVGKARRGMTDIKR